MANILGRILTGWTIIDAPKIGLAYATNAKGLVKPYNGIVLCLAFSKDGTGSKLTILNDNDKIVNESGVVLLVKIKDQQ